MTNVLGPIGMKLIEDRGLDPEAATKLGIYTGRVVGEDKDRRVIPDARGNILVFPFFEHGVVVNEKYRTSDKKFWQRVGGRKTFWNADVLDDPALARGDTPLNITEGEFDGEAAIECGFPFTVSVPDGAPPPIGDQEEQPIDPQAERTGKYEFLWNNRDRLKRVKRFVLAVDGDQAGQRLASELVRRLGAARCSFITYPTQTVVPFGDDKRVCKDLNEVKQYLGAERVATILAGATPYPVRGLYKLSEYPGGPEKLTVYSTGWDMLDDAEYGWMKVFPGELMVVTGIPSHGKSTWIANLLVNLARNYGWPAAIFSPEMPTIPHHRNKLRRILSYEDNQPVAMQDAFIENFFTFIDNDPTGNSEEDVTLEWLLERAQDSVLRYGIRVLVIDPWNEIEHARRRDENMVEYIGRALRTLKRFARQYEVMVIVAAHPTKDIAKDGKRRIPNLYDIEGAAHWFNKPDHGVVIYRPDPTKDETTIINAKTRFDDTGRSGQVTLKFVPWAQRYVKLDTHTSEMQRIEEMN